MYVCQKRERRARNIPTARAIHKPHGHHNAREHKEASHTTCHDRCRFTINPNVGQQITSTRLHKDLRGEVQHRIDSTKLQPEYQILRQLNIALSKRGEQKHTSFSTSIT
jgi:hypothetical protein